MRWTKYAWVPLLLWTGAAYADDAVRGRVANPHGELKVPCESCHTTTAWRPIRKQPEFSHDTQTTFPLRGLHTNVECRSCHVSLVFADAGTQCADCHADIHRRQFGARCQDCHTVRGWKTEISAIQQHTNRFPLIGAHSAVACDMCHTGAASGVFTGLSTQCVSCHLRDYQTGVPLNHQAAKLSTACETCHTMDRWQGARFDHSSLTKFALTGAHATVDCAQCHANGRFQGIATDCFSCHATDFTKAAPNHVAAGFPHDCTSCHNTSSWSGATFDHTTTGFTLTGAHVSVACADCHVAGRFANTPTQCSGCHLPDFEKTNNPDHRSGHFSNACETCHTTANWNNAKFDHNTLTSFQLTGAHASVACAQCHVNNNFSSTPNQCVGCHLPDFQKAANPNHVSAGFPQDCAVCHTTAQWTGAKFDHNTATKFVLAGAHVNLACGQCHTGGVFAGTPMQCNGCHLNDFKNAANPNHVAAGFPQDCAACHTNVNWDGAKFDHSTTKFPLTGVHSTTACAQCHVNSVFAGTPVQCAGCHLKDFQGATNPNHVAAAFPQDCAVCHNTASWNGAKFDHTAMTKFPLTGAHTTVDCAQCHANGVFSGTTMQCSGCHLTDFQKTANPNHVSAGFPQDCAICHTTVQWMGAKFDHNTATKFPLIGAHANAACGDCHAGGVFAATPTACVGCHLSDFQKTTSPNHAAAGFSQQCETCHTSSNWSGAKFDHSTTKFPLTGAHTSVTCGQCHVNGQFATLPAACVSCHLPDFQKTTSPNHVTAGFPQQCEQCHTTANWLGATFDHSTTKFPLTGAHSALACNTCHANGQFAALATACAGCHLTDFQKATNPNHVSAGFPQQCEACHTTAAWSGAVFDHAKTKFPLTGAHAAANCAQCHANGQFAALATACAGCHLTDFQKATNPNHISAGFPQDCAVCHTTAQWTGAKFDHNTATKFALTGAHTSLQCQQCHVNNVFAGTPAQCTACHLNDFRNAKNPDHVAAAFPQDCQVCHGTSSWSGASFDHSKTQFPLTGAHMALTCDLCHKNGQFASLPSTCVSCHLTDFQKTTNPNHTAAAFPQDCSLCHSTLNWNGAKFDHNALTKFPLTGAHVTLDCAQCHANGRFAGTPMQCSGCHLSDFQKAASPPHVSAGFPQDCAVCHTTAQWMGAKFDHSTTGFALTGAHSSAQCAQCHVSNNFSLTSAACINCHQADYNGTTNPNHKTAGFPTACEGCHTTVNWDGAVFNHASTGFALTGAHSTAQCAQCHVNGNFSLTSAACINCHQTDYNSTTNPNHKAAGFPTACEGCHSTINWDGAVFNHATTGFALTGGHATVQCAQCHVNGNFTLTSGACINCHQADYNGANSPPHKAAGFPQDCTLCHSTANWTSATFNHATTGFALTGAHSSAQCAQCHVNNNYSLTNAACINCHQADYNGTTNPNHKTAGFPTACEGCHTTANWDGAAFNHATTGFALTGGHATVQCAQCHVNGNFNLTSAACINCHQADYNGATNPPHKAAGFPQDCTLCHSTANWTSATFNHATTGFALTGAHSSAQCAQCHVNNNYSLTSAACINCHQADYNGTTNPNHKASGFPTTCDSCHTTTNWDGAVFNHATTGFALTGAHSKAQCAQCHVNNNYSLTSAACINCHQADYNGTTNPNHKASGFPTTCDSCHTTTNWDGATFNHATTGFALTGGHANVQCAQCHVNNNFNLTSAACVNCHLNDYNGATNPPHKSAGFPQDCTLCHTTTNWTSATFNHATTGFALTGAHTSLQCAQCHVNNNYNITSAQCVSCHQSDYNGTTNPNHKSAGFPTDCTVCHSTTNWTSATFNHNNTPFPLTGKHTSVQCAQCHVNNVFAGLTTACSGCHMADYNGTTNPNHKAQGFPTTCDSCHTTAGWDGATFNHATTGFALTGAHASVQCATCHVNNNYNLTSAACINCHLADYNGTTNPPHKASGFPQDCSGCHTTTNWSGATFNHATTGFTLTGAHTSLACSSCHVNNNFSLTSAACVNCHQADYSGTTNPPHKSAGFPTTCDTCHTTTNWDGATFDHSKTGFALTGAHTSVACSSCHVSNNYNLTSAACVNCHQSDYNGTTNPNHKASGFPTTCDTCHTTSSWAGATFNHTQFPIYSGTHAGRWTTCADCHTNSSDYSVFSCITCHQHAQANTDPNHRGVKNYVYNATSCYSCHPQGRAD